MVSLVKPFEKANKPRKTYFQHHKNGTQKKANDKKSKKMKMSDTDLVTEFKSSCWEFGGAVVFRLKIIPNMLLTLQHCD